jgi:hypothetical protein
MLLLNWLFGCEGSGGGGYDTEYDDCGVVRGASEGVGSGMKWFYCPLGVQES